MKAITRRFCAVGFLPLLVFRISRVIVEMWKYHAGHQQHLVGLLLFSMLLCACATEEEKQAQPKEARLSVRLTDKPGNYQAVNIDIQDVQVNTGEGGWKSLDVNKGIYDLLKLTNGLDTLLGEAELPPGRISQLRLVLGDNNTIRVDGRTEKLSTPSAQQSGLKVQVEMDLVAGGDYEVLLDFDAARSIVKTGLGRYKLKPVIRAFILDGGDDDEDDEGAEDDDNDDGDGDGGGGAISDFGAISGAVAPAASNPAIHAILGMDTVSAMVDVSGRFLIGGLPQGSYRVAFVPIDGYLQEELTGIAVVRGDTTKVGIVAIGHL